MKLRITDEQVCISGVADDDLAVMTFEEAVRLGEQFGRLLHDIRTRAQFELRRRIEEAEGELEQLQKRLSDTEVKRGS